MFRRHGSNTRMDKKEGIEVHRKLRACRKDNQPARDNLVIIRTSSEEVEEVAKMHCIYWFTSPLQSSQTCHLSLCNNLWVQCNQWGQHWQWGWTVKQISKLTAGSGKSSASRPQEIDNEGGRRYKRWRKLIGNSCGLADLALWIKSRDMA